MGVGWAWREAGGRGEEETDGGGGHTDKGARREQELLHLDRPRNSRGWQKKGLLPSRQAQTSTVVEEAPYWTATAVSSFFTKPLIHFVHFPFEIIHPFN